MIFFLSVFQCSLADSSSRQRIGVLYSYKNVEYYDKNDIVGFSHVWKSFLETFHETYLNYQFLCNISSDTRIQDIGTDVIFFPLAIDISLEEKEFLNRFIAGGGKLLISAGVGPVSENLKQFLVENGIPLIENTIAKQTLNYKVDDTEFDLPIGNFYSVFEPSGPGKKVLVRWRENNTTAIGGNKNLAYIGYSWGQDIETSSDAAVLITTLDYFWNGVPTKLAKEISEHEYKQILQEINVIQQQANSVIQIADQLDLSIPKYKLQKHFDNAIKYFKEFNSNYLFGNYLQSRSSATLAKNEFAIVYSLGIPVKKVEIRAIWLDRGTIVSMKNAYELAALIKDLAKSGFNVIFFETLNAGYPIYPSNLLPQNPLVVGWDPLKVAIEAAHSYGVELHAWVWTFAVGNTRHNLLIGKPVQYPGPLISTKGRAWALASEGGAIKIDMQPEVWISPANRKACDFLTDVFSEIVKKYDIDGLQLDYIRFPFQKQHSQVGFDFVTKNAFKEATGMLPASQGPINKVWTEWKIKMVSNFVHDLSLKLKKIKPELKLSVAVFGIDRSLRLKIIQQDWESWLVNKWVDVAYPFYYSYTKAETEAKIKRAIESVNNSAIIIPSFNLRVLSVGDLAERVTLVRNSGVLGLCLFATEHLSGPKKNLLTIGPFREKADYMPYKDPLVACQKLLEEFSQIIDKFTITKKLSALGDSETQKEVYYLTSGLKNDFKSFTPEKINEIENKIVSLQLKVKDWLSLEKYLNRDQRVTYIITYLEQIRTLLNYMREKNYKG